MGSKKKHKKTTCWRPNATLAEMVHWAKDRALDDLLDHLKDKQNDPKMHQVDYYEFRRGIYQDLLRSARLLNLPVARRSLTTLRKANYWNGAEDSFWDFYAKPSWYKGD